jgi:hypothetical protein
MKTTHRDDENPGRGESYYAGCYIQGARTRPAQLQRSITGGRIVKTQQRNYREKGPEVEYEQAYGRR